VLYIEFSSDDMKAIIDGLYLSYGQLIQYGMKGYQKSRGEKGTLELDASAAGDAKANEAYNNIANGGFKTFAEAESAIMPLYRGMKYTPFTSKTYTADNTRDIRAMIDDVTDFTARGLGIPASLLNGSVQDVSSATDQLLTFAVDPLVDNIATEINRQRYGKTAVLRGDGVRIDTSCIKHIDLLGQASNIDKLLSSGVECVNDIRVMLGQTIINEPWAWQHFMTKNYSTVEELLTAMGGENK
jgi:HK97 family phage portal protein